MFDADGYCLTREGCALGWGRVVDGRACVSRDAWLGLDGRNFVGVGLDAQAHAEVVGEGSSGIDAETLCLTPNGEKIEGARLVAGKFCQCPEWAPYFDWNSQKCMNSDKVYENGGLTREIRFSYAGVE